LSITNNNDEFYSSYSYSGAHLFNRYHWYRIKQKKRAAYYNLRGVNFIVS
jgi:hypothetical protein